MSIEYRIYDMPGGIAAEDFSAAGSLAGNDGAGNACGQFLFVKQNQVTIDNYVHCNSVNDRPDGVSQNNPKSGSGLTVRCLGRSKITAGLGGIALGDLVGPETTTGRGITVAANVTGAGLGRWVMGICKKAAAQGELGEIDMIGLIQVAL